MAQFEPTTRAEQKRQFIRAYERLVRAGAAYDQGHWSEAPNIAKEVFSFVYDHGNSTKSVLTQLGLRNNIEFVSTAKGPLPAMSERGLLVSPDYRLIVDEYCLDGIQYRPRFEADGDLGKLMSFTAWFSETILTWHGRGTINREELLKFVRDKVGGGHIASGHYRTEHTDRMVDLLSGGWLFMQQQMPDGTARGPEPDQIAFATLRQIGWEMDQTLRRSCPDLVARANLNPAPGPRMGPMPPFL